MTKPDPADKIDLSNKKYRDSNKGKAAQKKYLDSRKGKEASRRYLDSDKGKAAQLRYRLSEKGQTTVQRHNNMSKLMNECREWLEENPGATATDFFAILGGDDGEA